LHAPMPLQIQGVAMRARAYHGRSLMTRPGASFLPFLHQEGGDIAPILHLGVILRLIANDPSGIGKTPEFSRIVGNPVEDLKWDAPLIVDLGALDRLLEQLRQVPRADVGP